MLNKYASIYLTTPTNIWAWRRAIMITLELYGCCKANIECRSQPILAVSCLWPTYSTFIQCLLHGHRLDLYYTVARSRFSTLPRMRLYDVGKDHEESMHLISNVRLITRVYGMSITNHEYVMAKIFCVISICVK